MQIFQAYLTKISTYDGFLVNSRTLFKAKVKVKELFMLFIFPIRYKCKFVIFALAEAFVPCTLLLRWYFDRDQDSLVLSVTALMISIADS